MELSNFFNIDLARHPTNWLIVFVCLLTGAFFLDLTTRYFKSPLATKDA